MADYPEANLRTVEAAGIFGSDDPAVRAHADDMKKQLARLAPGADISAAQKHRSAENRKVATP